MRPIWRGGRSCRGDSEGRAGGGHDDPAGLVQGFHRAAAGFERAGARVCDFLEFEKGLGGGVGYFFRPETDFQGRRREVDLGRERSDHFRLHNGGRQTFVL